MYVDEHKKKLADRITIYDKKTGVEVETETALKLLGLDDSFEHFVVCDECLSCPLYEMKGCNGSDIPCSMRGYLL